MTATNPLLNIDRYAWPRLRTANERGAEMLPALLATMWTEDERTSAGASEQILDHIMISDLLFEVAEPTAAVLTSMAIVADDAQRLLPMLSLLEDLALGEAHESEIRLGNSLLQQRVRAEIARGAALFIALLSSPHPALQAYSLVILSCVEPRSERLRLAIRQLEGAHVDPVIQDALVDVKERLSAYEYGGGRL